MKKPPLRRIEEAIKRAEVFADQMPEEAIKTIRHVVYFLPDRSSLNQLRDTLNKLSRSQAREAIKIAKSFILYLTSSKKYRLWLDQVVALYEVEIHRQGVTLQASRISFYETGYMYFAFQYMGKKSPQQAVAGLINHWKSSHEVSQGA